MTGIVGEPNVDLREGIEKEQVLMNDSNEAFTTSNYSITTSPVKEYTLVVGFVLPGAKQVIVARTTRCDRPGGFPQQDVRSIRTIDCYMNLDSV